MIHGSGMRNPISLKIICDERLGVQMNPWICILLLMVFAAIPAIAEETAQNSTNSTDQNLSEPIHITDTNRSALSPFSLNQSADMGTNLTANETESVQNQSEMNATDKKAASPTPTPVYKLSIGSVYSADYKEPQPRVFTYSGCG